MRRNSLFAKLGNLVAGFESAPPNSGLETRTSSTSRSDAEEQGRFDEPDDGASGPSEAIYWEGDGLIRRVSQLPQDGGDDGGIAGGESSYGQVW